MSDFADWDPEDSIVANNAPDPIYVARRVHETRLWLEAEAGAEIENEWDALSAEEQDIAIALGVQLTVHLLGKGRDGSALALHEARRFFGALPEWRDLDSDVQAVALAMADGIVRWLQVEGTVIA